MLLIGNDRIFAYILYFINKNHTFLKTTLEKRILWIAEKQKFQNYVISFASEIALKTYLLKPHKLLTLRGTRASK